MCTTAVCLNETSCCRDEPIGDPVAPPFLAGSVELDSRGAWDPSAAEATSDNCARRLASSEGGTESVRPVMPEASDNCAIRLVNSEEGAESVRHVEPKAEALVEERVFGLVDGGALPMMRCWESRGETDGCQGGERCV